jgi:hypothetical protein
MKTKFLLIAAAHAMLSLGNFSYAQESAVLSAENTMALPVARQNEIDHLLNEMMRQALSRLVKNEEPVSPEAVELHHRITHQMQEFLLKRMNEENRCAGDPAGCEYDFETKDTVLLY